MNEIINLLVRNNLKLQNIKSKTINTEETTLAIRGQRISVFIGIL